MTDRRTQSRRNAMGVLLTGALTLPVAAAAARGQLAIVEPLEALWREYVDATAASNAAHDAHEDAVDAAIEDLPDWPDSLTYKATYVRADGQEEDVEYRMTAATIKQWRAEALARSDVTPGVRKPYDAMLRELEACERERQRIYEAHNVPALAKAADAAMDRLEAAIDAVIATPARTMRGVAIKLRLMIDEEDHHTGEFSAAPAADVEAIITGQVPS